MPSSNYSFHNVFIGDLSISAGNVKTMDSLIEGLKSKDLRCRNDKVSDQLPERDAEGWQLIAQSAG